MAQYHFYYDESEHSRKINLSTVISDNYYDNFIAAFVGWKSENENLIFKNYVAFEEKYNDRKSKGELKSQTLKQKYFDSGFASMNKDNICFIDDFLSLFDENISVYFSVISKIEFIISQIFDGYESSFMYDMDAMRYSIIKAILMYRPKEIIEGVFENTGELIDALKVFFEERIELNKLKLSLKQRESKTFGEILMVLDDICDINTINWNYDIAFLGFKQYLIDREIKDFKLTIDKEGKEGENSNTLNAAKHVGFNTAIEMDSKDSVGVRISDMLAGLISKLLKSLHHALRYNSSNDKPEKKLLNEDWFSLSQEQLELYKKMYNIVCESNNDLYKKCLSKYSDDLIVFIALLNYMNQFSSAEELKKDIDMQGEYFNAYACKYLEDYFFQMGNKLPIKSISLDEKEFLKNEKNAKVFFDIQRQPLLKLPNGIYKCHVLSIGFSKEGIPLATIAEHGGNYCYRLPNDLREWAMSIVGFANMGTNLFPSEVVFTKDNDKIYADIL
ncbi:MAG: hypothetical protein E7E58_09125 [Paeniclostridium sordellii]|nr:hypothetical protein [Paeniclostridium sordellii]